MPNLMGGREISRIAQDYVNGLNATPKNGPSSKDGTAELNTKMKLLQKLIADAAVRDIALLYTSLEQRYNNVIVLRKVLDELLAHENHA